MKKILLLVIGLSLLGGCATSEAPAVDEHGHSAEEHAKEEKGGKK
jgi:hypothetical protein